jgi:hypothetical protein
MWQYFNEAVMDCSAETKHELWKRAHPPKYKRGDKFYMWRVFGEPKFRFDPIGEATANYRYEYQCFNTHSGEFKDFEEKTLTTLMVLQINE